MGLRRTIRWAVCLGALGVVASCGDDDGAPSDAATPTDGSADVGPIDVGPIDAGPRDSGPRDTGPIDAGEPDEGPADVGARDDGPPVERCDRVGTHEELPCGRCGTQRRFCTSSSVWEYGDCVGEHGVCDPGVRGTMPCGEEAIDARCTDACVWVPVDRDARCPLPGCDDPIEVFARPDETVSVDLDTSIGEPGPLDVGGGCFFFGPSRLPQVVLAVRNDASALRRVSFSLRNEGTDPELDGVVEVRRGACDTAPPLPPPTTCFDTTMTDPREVPPPPPLDPRPSGAFAASPGEVVYLVVTGNPSPMAPATRSVGRARVELTNDRPVSAPLLRVAEVEVGPDNGVVSIGGTDADADAETVRVSFFDEAGAPVDFDGDGTVGPNDVYVPFLETPLLGARVFAAEANQAGSFLLDRVEATGARRAGITVVDSLGLAGPLLFVDIRVHAYAEAGQSCGGARACRFGLACVMGICREPPGVGEACDAATPIDLAGVPASGSVTGSLAAGPGVFEGSCGFTTGGPEALYTVAVPDGDWDLLLTTQTPGTPVGTDTVLYVRSTCRDATTELACVDDDGDLRSRLTVRNVAPGEHTVVLERYGGVAAGSSITYELVATLRPVLGAGDACDPTGTEDRCASGTCSDGVCR